MPVGAGAPAISATWRSSALRASARWPVRSAAVARSISVPGGTGSFVDASRSVLSAPLASPDRKLRASVQGTRAARPAAHDSFPQRLQRLSAGDPVLGLRGDAQPDFAQRGVDLDVVGEAFGGAAKRRHGQIGPPRVFVLEAQRDEARRASAVERDKRLELLARIKVAAGRAIAGGQGLPSRNQRRLKRDGAFEGLSRFDGLALGGQTEPRQVMRLRELGIERQRPAHRRPRALGLSGAVVGQAQLIEHPRRAVVELRVSGVPLRGPLGPLQRQADVAQLLEWPRRRGVERRGGPESRNAAFKSPWRR